MINLRVLVGWFLIELLLYIFLFLEGCFFFMSKESHSENSCKNSLNNFPKSFDTRLPWCPWIFQSVFLTPKTFCTTQLSKSGSNRWLPCIPRPHTNFALYNKSMYILLHTLFFKRWLYFYIPNFHINNPWYLKMHPIQAHLSFLLSVSCFPLEPSWI